MTTRKPPPRNPAPSNSSASKWLPSIAATGVLGVVVLAGISGAGGNQSAATSTSSGGSIVDPSFTAPSSTLPSIVVGSDPAVQKTTLSQSVSNGSQGDDVKKVQQRLTDLGFAPGPIDGAFGENTRQSVWAYEKLILHTPRLEATGTVTNEMWQGMQDSITVQPRRRDGSGSTHVEIYLPEQVLIVFTADVPTLIAHVSSGELDDQGQPKEFCETGKFDTDANGEKLDPPIERQFCARAKTPGGVFRFKRFYDGKRISALGGMTNPWYFNYGIAVHGAEKVPLYPASHGCIRINQMLAKVFPAMVAKGDVVYVWGHDGKEPEQYSKNESLPSFNYDDPNASTTTSSTSTTVPKSTTSTSRPPTTTARPPNTTVAPATTVPTTTTTVSSPPST